MSSRWARIGAAGLLVAALLWLSVDVQVSMQEEGAAPAPSGAGQYPSCERGEASPGEAVLRWLKLGHIECARRALAATPPYAFSQPEAMAFSAVLEGGSPPKDDFVYVVLTDTVSVAVTRFGGVRFDYAAHAQRLRTLAADRDDAIASRAIAVIANQRRPEDIAFLAGLFAGATESARVGIVAGLAIYCNPESAAVLHEAERGHREWFDTHRGVVDGARGYCKG